MQLSLNTVSPSKLNLENSVFWELQEYLFDIEQVGILENKQQFREMIKIATEKGFDFTSTEIDFCSDTSNKAVLIEFSNERGEKPSELQQKIGIRIKASYVPYSYLYLGNKLGEQFFKLFTGK